MNKSDLINEVAEVVESKGEAQAAVECVFSSIAGALKAKDTVTIAGFGSFKVSERAARKGRHPQTGAEIEIKAMSVPKFTPAKALKTAVN